MATIRKRAQKWQVLIRRKGHPVQCRSFPKRAEAQAWARHIECEMDRGATSAAHQPLPGYTVGQIIARYRDEITVRKLSHNTETYILNAFLRHPVASLPLTEITLADFHAYRYERLEHVKPGTINRELGIIRHAFDVAMHEWGICLPKNPLEHMKKMKPQNGRTRRLEQGELKILEHFFSRIRNPYLVPLIYFAIETAMRRGEILAMKWQDINFKNNTLHIPVTKNGYSRTIPLTARAVEILHALPRKHHERVFATSANAVKMAWQRLAERTGIDDLHFHDLRHEAISRLFEKGLSVPEVALISGHRDYRMLFRYTHLKPEDLAKKLRQL